MNKSAESFTEKLIKGLIKLLCLFKAIFLKNGVLCLKLVKHRPELFSAGEKYKLKKGTSESNFSQNF